MVRSQPQGCIRGGPRSGGTEDAKAVGDGYCRLQMPLKLALAVRETVAGRRLGALEEGPGQRVEKQGTWASRTQKHSEAGYRRPVDRGVWTAWTNDPGNNTSSIRQLLGAANAQTAHHATSSTAPAHQRRGSANAETTPAGAPAAAADRTQRPDATCGGKNG